MKWNNADRRTSTRLKKNFILSYFIKDDAQQKQEITQLKNISMGGMCFITTRSYAKGTNMGVELRTPYLTDTTCIDGTVLESHEKIKNMIYETRLVFKSLNPQAEFLLAKLSELFIEGEGNDK